MPAVYGLRRYPITFAVLEAKAAAAMPPKVWGYVAGGAGDEHIQRANCHAFRRWGLFPRMLMAPTQRDLSVEVFGITLPSPVFMAPIGVIGVCVQDGHGDLVSARAARTPPDRELAANPVHRAEAAGFKGIAVPVNDTGVSGLPARVHPRNWNPPTERTAASEPNPRHRSLFDIACLTATAHRAESRITSSVTPSVPRRRQPDAVLTG